MFGDRLKKLRTDQKKTLKDLYEKTGYSVSYLNGLENNKKKNPSREVIDKLSASLNVVPSYFYEKESELPFDFKNHLTDDIKEWLTKEESVPYLIFAKKISEEDLPINLIEDTIELVRKHMKK